MWNHPLKILLWWFTVIFPVALLKVGHELTVTATDLTEETLESNGLSALFWWHQPVLHMASETTRASFKAFLESLCCSSDPHRDTQLSLYWLKYPRNSSSLFPQSQSELPTQVQILSLTQLISFHRPFKTSFFSVDIYTSAPTLIFTTATLFCYMIHRLWCCGNCCFLSSILGVLKGLGEKKDKEKTSGQWKELHPSGRRSGICSASTQCSGLVTVVT